MTKPGYTSQSNPQLNLAASFLVPAVPTQAASNNSPIKALQDAGTQNGAPQPVPAQ